MEPTTFSKFLPLLVGAAILTGCGGGGVSTSSKTAIRGAVRLSVEWPALSEAAAHVESVSVAVSVNGVEAERTILDRPVGEAAAETSYTFANLPEGAATTEVTAYSEADAKGTTLATGAASDRVASGETLLQSATPAAEGDLTVTTTGKTSTGSLSVGIH